MLFSLFTIIEKNHLGCRHKFGFAQGGNFAGKGPEGFFSHSA